MPPHEQFDPNRLDEILNDAVPTALPTRMDLNVEQFMTPDGKIDRDKVYAELGKLIASGNWLVQGFSRVNPDTEGALSGMASVIASLRQLIGEFTKIHNQELKFEQQTQMERIKLDFKMQLQERKHQMDLEKIEKMKSLGGDGAEQKNLVRFSSEQVLADYHASKKQLNS